MKETKEVFYINMGSSHDLRRGILETSKEVIETLHRFEKFKTTRADRIKTVEQLILQFKEITELTARLKAEMPKVKLPNIKMPEMPKKELVIDPESDDEIKKLEDAINDIEERLGEIG